MIKKRKLICIIITLVTASAIAVGVIAFSGKSKNTLSIASMNKISVKVIKANTGSIASNASFKASLEASEEGIISNKVGGKVVQVSFEDGQTVSAGQVLAKLDDTDIRNSIKSSEAQLASAQAQLKSAQSSAESAQLSVNKPQVDLQTAQNNYNRTKALYEQGAATQVDYENAEAQLETAEGALASAKASAQSSNVATETQEASIQKAQVDLNTQEESLQNTVITAPTSGIITGKSINVGQYVSPGTALAKVETISPICAVINIKESDLNYVKLGTKAKFKLSDDSLTEYDGVVKSIDAAADATSRMFKCEVQIDNKDGKLKPGVFGNVKIATDENEKAIMLPLRAVGGTQGDYYIFVDDNGVARKQTITTGEVSKDSVEIKSGVKTGDSVICTNISTLQDGDVVKAVAE